MGAADAAPPPDGGVPPPPVLGALLVVQLSFSLYHVVGKFVLASVHPLALAGLRVLFATPLLVAWAWRSDRVLPRRRDLAPLALIGLLGVFLNQILFIFGLRWTTATNAAILMPSIPVFAVAVGALLGIERLGPRRLLGVALAVTGSLALLDPRQASFDRQTLLGNLLVLANCLSYAAFLVAQRPLLMRLPWRTVIAWAFLFGSLGVVPLSTPALLRLEPLTLAPAVWWGVFYILLFPTVVGYALNTWAVRRSSPALVAAFTTLQPLLTAVLAFALLGERFGPLQGLGFGLIAAGLWRVSWRPGR